MNDNAIIALADLLTDVDRAITATRTNIVQSLVDAWNRDNPVGTCVTVRVGTPRTSTAYTVQTHTTEPAFVVGEVYPRAAVCVWATDCSGIVYLDAVTLRPVDDLDDSHNFAPLAGVARPSRWAQVAPAGSYTPAVAEQYGAYLQWWAGHAASRVVAHGPNCPGDIPCCVLVDDDSNTAPPKAAPSPGHARTWAGRRLRIDEDGSVHALVPAWRPSWFAGEDVLPVAQGCAIERVQAPGVFSCDEPTLGYRLTQGGAPVAARRLQQDLVLRQALVSIGWTRPDDLADGAIWSAP